MKTALETRILAAVAYADVFRYPMTVRELSLWTPSRVPMSVRSVIRSCKTLVAQKKIAYNPPFYFLKGHEHIIRTRIHRLVVSSAKWKKIRTVARALQLIPTIVLIGVTGGLSMNNADTKDDIDLMIVTKGKTLWTTRFLATVIISCIAKRRKPNDTEIADAMCLNMFLTDRAMTVVKNEQGWYAAHEVLQMAPAWERGSAYRNFLKANAWVRHWFPAAYAEKKRLKVLRVSLRTKDIKLYRFFEHPLKHLQLWYMKKRRTTEIVSDTRIRFHPVDARLWITRAFVKRLRQLKIPLDKNVVQI